MKSNYEKYIKEVWEVKEAVYSDYLASDYKSYLEYLKDEAKKLNIKPGKALYTKK